MIHHLLFNERVNIQRRAYLWNMLSSLFYSVQSALFLLIATRVAGEAEAGGFILLFTVAQTLNTVGNYNLRDFQASDVKEEYSFSTYFTTRVITCALMMILAVTYCLWKQLSAESTIVMICLAGYRMIECIEDVFHGDIQRAGRFDVTSICMTVRIILASVIFCAVYIISGSQVPASVALLLVCFVISIFLLHIIRTEFRQRTPIRFSTKNIPRLLIAAFPVFICAFLYTYLINVPKYAIADLMSAETQTVFNILFMPAFVINILSMFIFKPLTVQMSLNWNNGEYQKFGKGVRKQSLLVVGLTAFVILAGELIGLKILEWMYGVQLSEHRLTFALLLLSGGISAMAYFFNLILTIMRAQVYIIAEYAFALLISVLVTNPLITSKGILGASIAYGCICSAQMLFGLGVVLLKLNKQIKNA